MNFPAADHAGPTSIPPAQVAPLNSYSSSVSVPSIAVSASSRHAGSPKARKVHKTHAPKSGSTRSTLHHKPVDGMIDGLEYQAF